MTRISVVAPARDEAASLPELIRRLSAVAHDEGWDWELVLVLDGCTDDSAAQIAACGEPDVRIIDLPASRGQHAALDVGLRQARGAIVLTMDADLQVLPESLPALVGALDAGADAVAGWRNQRQDLLWRRLVSRGFNAAASRLVGLPGHDLGCMLRGYRRETLDRYLSSGEAPLYLPIQIGRHARRSAEVVVAHAERAYGTSNYDARRLARLALAVLRSRFCAPRVAPPAPFRQNAPPGSGESGWN